MDPKLEGAKDLFNKWMTLDHTDVPTRWAEGVLLACLYGGPCNLNQVTSHATEWLKERKQFKQS